MANMWGPQQTPQNNSMVAFVNDESMAVNYPVSPGFTVAVINASDPNSMKMYLKSSQPNGMPNPTQVFSLTNITPKAEGKDSVSRQEFDEFAQKVLAILESQKGSAKK